MLVSKQVHYLFMVIFNSTIKNILLSGLRRYNRQFNLKSLDSFILAYHSVVNDKQYDNNGFQPNASFKIKRRDFESQIKFLKKNYEILPLNVLIDLLKKKDDVTGKIAITFDDGYRDNYEHAYPILREHEVPATIYLLASIFNNDNILLWWLQLEETISSAKECNIRFKFMNTEYTGTLKNDESKKKFFMKISRLLIKSEPAKQRDLLIALTEAAGLVELSDHRDYLLFLEMIMEMKDSGLISFGSHTFSHCALNILSKSDLKRDVLESKRVIESYLGDTITSFSFPYGKSLFINKRVLRIVKKAGYLYAVTGIPGGLVSRSGHNTYLLPRISMAGCSSNEQLQIRISRIYNHIKYFVT